MFKQELVNIIKKFIPLPENKISNLLEIPPDHKLGDFAFPCFSLAKELKKAPPVIAQELAEKIPVNNILSEVKNIGPYLNFFISPKARAEKVIISKPWNLDNKQNQKILIEYPSPNTNKPLHLGHVRNMILGSTLSIILKTAGNKVVQVNLNNDRGIHICKSMLAYKKWGNNASPDKKSDHYVGDWYVKYAEEEAKNPELKEEAQEMLRKWEADDKEVVALWKKMNKWAFDGFHETFNKFNIKFDKEYYESQIYKEGKNIVLNNLNLFEKDDTGAIIVNLEKFNLPNKVLLRSDGTSIYMTQDIALTINKNKEFNPDKQIWIVGNEQNLHFQQLFAILKLLNINEEFYHLSYGMISLPDGRMKSREGRVVDADDILEEMEKLAISEIKKRQDWPEEKIINTAKKISMGAIKFFIIKYDPSKDFVFNPDNSLNFEGDTGPYIQYTHARICSILREATNFNGDPKLLITEEEQALLRVIEKTPLFFEKAIKELRPNVIANHLLSIGHAFNSFYHSCPVLKAEENIKHARLELLKFTRNVISEGLYLLGIESPEEM